MFISAHTTAYSSIQLIPEVRGFILLAVDKIEVSFKVRITKLICKCKSGSEYTTVYCSVAQVTLQRGFIAQVSDKTQVNLKPRSTKSIWEH